MNLANQALHPEYRNVCVVIPFYNRSEFLERLLDSVAAQTVIPQHIYIIDNGSCIAEIKEAYKLAQKFSSSLDISLVSTLKTGNANYARNLGLELSEQRFVAFLDSDDWWEEAHIEASLKVLAMSKRTGVYSGARTIRRFNSKLELSADVNSLPNPLSFLFENKHIAQTSSYILDKETLGRTSWDDKLKRHQDYDFFLQVYYNTNGWAFNNSTLTNVDWRAGGTRKISQFRSMIRFLNKWEDKFPRKSLENYLANQVVITSKSDASDLFTNFYRKKLKKLHPLAIENKLKICPLHIKIRKIISAMRR